MKDATKGHIWTAAYRHREKCAALVKDVRAIAGTDGTAHDVLRAFMDEDDRTGGTQINPAVDVWNNALYLQGTADDALKAADNALQIAEAMLH